MQADVRYGMADALLCNEITTPKRTWFRVESQTVHPSRKELLHPLPIMLGVSTNTTFILHNIMHYNVSSHHRRWLAHALVKHLFPPHFVLYVVLAVQAPKKYQLLALIM